jgi:MFS superfamily sulfate permease-like transporter
MPKKYIVFLKTIGRSWFLILVIIIVIIAFFNLLAAILMAVITLILFLLSYIPKFMLRNKLFKFMKGYYKIEDELIAKKFKKPISKIREKMFELSQAQEKRKWLIVFMIIKSLLVLKSN